MTEGGFWSLCDRCFLWPYTFNLALISDKKFQITQDESDLDLPDPGEAHAPADPAAVW